MSTPERPPLRIGHQEREAAYAALNTHLEAGRLDAEEYGERYAKASMARTRDEIDAQFLDLPAPHATPAPHAPTRPVPPPAARPIVGRVAAYAPRFLGLAPFLALGLFFATGAWICFLLIPATAVLFGGRTRARSRRRRRGCW